jgi:hypothetical protein
MLAEGWRVVLMSPTSSPATGTISYTNPFVLAALETDCSSLSNHHPAGIPGIALGFRSAVSVAWRPAPRPGSLRSSFLLSHPDSFWISIVATHRATMLSGNARAGKMKHRLNDDAPRRLGSVQPATAKVAQQLARTISPRHKRASRSTCSRPDSFNRHAVRVICVGHRTHPVRRIALPSMPLGRARCALSSLRIIGP